MANEMQQTLVRMLGGTDEPAATVLLTDVFMSALSGDTESASAVFALMAEVHRQQRSLPLPLLPLAATALARAAASVDACKAVAQTKKKGRPEPTRRDALIRAQELRLREAEPLKKVRVATLAKLHSLSPRAIEVVLDAAGDGRIEEALKAADALLLPEEPK